RDREPRRRCSPRAPPAADVVPGSGVGGDRPAPGVAAAGVTHLRRDLPLLPLLLRVRGAGAEGAPPGAWLVVGGTPSPPVPSMEPGRGGPRSTSHACFRAGRGGAPSIRRYRIE